MSSNQSPQKNQLEADVKLVKKVSDSTIESLKVIKTESKNVHFIGEQNNPNPNQIFIETRSKFEGGEKFVDLLKKEPKSASTKPTSEKNEQPTQESETASEQENQVQINQMEELSIGELKNSLDQIVPGKRLELPNLESKHYDEVKKSQDIEASNSNAIKRGADQISENNTEGKSMDKLEGPRAWRLKALMEKTLITTLKTFSYDKIQSTFPGVAKSNPEELELTYEQAAKVWRDGVEHDFEIILEKTKVIEKLNQLDRHLLDVSSNVNSSLTKKPRINPSLSDLVNATPQMILKARNTKRLTQEFEHIKNMRLKIEQENVKLEEETRESGKKIMELSTQLSLNCDQLQKVIELANANTIEPEPKEASQESLTQD